jgi:hypothetical protein
MSDLLNYYLHCSNQRQSGAVNSLNKWGAKCISQFGEESEHGCQTANDIFEGSFRAGEPAGHFGMGGRLDVIPELYMHLMVSGHSGR